MRALAIVCLAVATLRPAPQVTPDAARLIAIFVVDGLRPDSINAADTPTIHRLRSEGVDYANGHSIFPTSTRVNAASLVSGTYPARHGIVGNTMFVAGVDPRAPLDTGDYHQLIRLEEAEGRMITAPTLAEVLQRDGRRLVTVSSGSTGNGLLLNPQSRHGAGVAIHGLFDTGKTAAFPPEVSDEVIRRFGSPPPDPDDIGQMEWTDTVLRDYVLPELRPDVVIDWMGPLDSAQHDHGVGSPAAKTALRAIDRSLTRTLSAMQTPGLPRRIDVVIASDHGFAQHTAGANVVQALIAAGLKQTVESTDIIVANQAQSVLFYVPSGDQQQIARLIRFLQQQPWAGVVFTRDGGSEQGGEPGTLSLALTQGLHPSRSPDVAVSLAWRPERNAYGVRGSHTISSTTAGRLTGGASGHGGLSPWVVHNTLVLWGTDFRSRARVSAPASLADVMPTVLEVLGVAKDSCTSGGCGRVLVESLSGPARPPSSVTRRSVAASAGPYRAVLRISTVAGHTYIDEGARQK